MAKRRRARQAAPTRRPIDPSTPVVDRWRLVLGKIAEQHGIDSRRERSERIGAGSSAALDFVFGGDPASAVPAPGGSAAHRAELGRRGQRAVPAPGEGGHAARADPRRGIAELMEKPELLEKIEPNLELVKTLLTHRDLLNPKTRGPRPQDHRPGRGGAEAEDAGPGRAGDHRRDPQGPALAAAGSSATSTSRRTLRRNLQNYDAERGKLLSTAVLLRRRAEEAAVARHRRRRPVGLDAGSRDLLGRDGVDLRRAAGACKTSLVLFDTQVVDLSDQVGQPVDVLLSIQLGGGTDITQALHVRRAAWSASRRATIVVLITDFYEGRDEQDLVAQVRADGRRRRPHDRPGRARLRRAAGVQQADGRQAAARSAWTSWSARPEKLAEAWAEIIRG